MNIRSARSGRQSAFGRLRIAGMALWPAMWLLLQCLGVTTAAAQSQTPLSSDAVPRLTIDTPIASEGYFVLRWDARSVAAPRLQGPATGDFTTAPDVPVMPEGSLTVTGLRDGEYLFRVGSEDNWSEVLRV